MFLSFETEDEKKKIVVSWIVLLAGLDSLVWNVKLDE